MKKKILFILGTRPEAIKLAPLILQLQKEKEFQISICNTGQHLDMLNQVLTFFNIVPEYNLALMQPGQTLFDISSKGLTKLQNTLDDFQPDLTIVQGDTTTAFIGALASFYKKIKVAHIEAGLRSGNKWSPYPEEINRKIAGVISDLHFAPTKGAYENLRKENINDNVYITGNTVIDALLLVSEKIKNNDEAFKQFDFIDPDKKLLLVTGHRRESFGEPFKNICTALAEIAERRNDIQIVYPVHLNPMVQQPVKKILSGKKNIFIIDPVDYPSMIWLLNKCYLVLTDSGGIQEEAPSLGKPILVLRDVTERQEGIDAGTAMLVGTDKQKIIEQTIDLLDNKQSYHQMAQAKNPYGDGSSSKQIIEILKTYLWRN
jgi:UDP-N-acetylglucosamine 2-epimerase (non-hydrolysing)